MKIKKGNQDKSELIIYQAEDGTTKVSVRLENETVWLTQKQIADLYQTTIPNVNQHLSSIYDEGELAPEATIKKYLIVQTEGSRQVQRTVDHYNLEAILAVGYRVRSHRGTQFRRWATERLREYVVKGFVMDDERLKQSGGGEYFDELLACIRDIRSSEKVFWRKVLDIYATSIDYDPNTDLSRQFFATIQNKMHWAAHGHTAAEIIAARADAQKPYMGLTSWTGRLPRRSDAEIAKNYLGEKELEALNRIVSLYLDFAELQAMNRRTMSMAGWISKLDEFLRLSERNILTHAGKISHEVAVSKAHEEFEIYKNKVSQELSPVEIHFLKVVEETKMLEKSLKKYRDKKGLKKPKGK